MNYWEIIVDNLKKAGWSVGYVSAVDSQGRIIWIADAHRGDGKRFVVRADDKLNAFLELERAVCIDLLSLAVESTEGKTGEWCARDRGEKRNRIALLANDAQARTTSITCATARKTR